MAEAFAGLGLMLGPVIGSLLYTVLEYMDTFLVLAVMLCVNLVLVFFALPNSLNYAEVEEKLESNLKHLPS